MSVPVSVITTVYNCEKYVERSIESILNQTFEDYEFIIVNDGSTDGTAALVRKYFSDKRIRFVPNQDNMKIPTRRNQAISMARGQYIAIHDGDDISKLDRLEHQYNFLRNNIAYFCIGGHAEKIDLDGNSIGMMDYPPAGHDDIVSMIRSKCMNPMIDPTTMFRKSDFLKLGSYTLDKSIYTVPDFDLWLNAIKTGRKFANLQSPLIEYRTNPDGMTGKHKQEMITAHMIVWSKFMRDYRKKNTTGQSQRI